MTNTQIAVEDFLHETLADQALPFAEILLAGMLAMNLSVGEVGEGAGFTRTQISKWLRGSGEPNMRSKLIVIDYLDRQANIALCGGVQ